MILLVFTVLKSVWFMHLRSEVSQHQPAASSVGTVSAPSSPFYNKKKRLVWKTHCSWAYFPLNSWFLPICNSKNTTSYRQRGVTVQTTLQKHLTSNLIFLLCPTLVDWGFTWGVRASPTLAEAKGVSSPGGGGSGVLGFRPGVRQAWRWARGSTEVTRPWGNLP